MSRWTTMLAALSLAACTAQARQDEVVDYPEGYRSWTHVKSMWLGPEHGLADPFAGLHHVYVDPEGERALKAEAPLPDGAVLVFDLLGGEIDEHAIREGARKLVGVMQKDRKAFATTGGWGFEAFRGDSKTDRLVDDGGASCFSCHQSQRPHDFVFTRWRR